MRLKSLFAIAVISWAAAAAAAPTYIHAGRLIDVPGNIVRGPSTIIVDNGRIISVTDGLTRAELERSGSLYRLLVEKFGIEPSESLESLGAVAAGRDEVELLGIAQGTPILVCERVMLSSRREPVEYCEMRYLPTYRYKTRINKWNIGQPA